MIRFPFDCFVECQRQELLTGEDRMMALVLDDAYDWQTERGRTLTCAAARTKSIRTARGLIFYTTYQSNVKGVSPVPLETPSGGKRSSDRLPTFGELTTFED
jgi:hypothetical protein